MMSPHRAASGALGDGVPSRAPRRVALLAALAVAGVLATGCGGDSSKRNADEAKKGGGSERTSLAVSIGAEPGSLDPLLDADGQTSTFQYSAYEGLTARRGSEIGPALATKWSLKGNTWTFTLRDGVKFHNGNALTADDVVASWKRVLSKDSENLGNIALADTKVKAVDESTVAISRPVPDPTTPARAALVLITPADFADLSSNKLKTEMMGTGPYRLDSWDRTQKITLSAFTEYWGEQPQIKQVSLQFDDEAAVRLASLQAGEVQMALNMSSDLDQGKFKVVATPISEVGMLRLNSEEGPFKDVRVRKAAALAINRDLLMKELYGGHARPAKGQIVAGYVFGANPDMQEYPFDPKRARQLLQEAGAVGTKVELVGTRGRWPSDAQVGEAAANMLNEAGFKVELKQPPFSDWLDAYFEKDAKAAPDLMLLNHSNQLFDSSYSIAQLLLCEGSSSTTCDPKLGELAEQALGETDEDRRADLYHQIWQMAGEQSYYVSIGEVLKLNFTDETVQWTPEADGFLRFQGMRIASS